MEEAPKKRDWKRKSRWSLVWVTALYVLSIGPFYKLSSMRAFPKPVEWAFRIGYVPLDLVAKSNPVTKRLYYWYIHDVWRAWR